METGRTVHTRTPGTQLVTRRRSEPGLEMGELNLKSQNEIAGSLKITFLLYCSKRCLESIVFDYLASGKILSSSRVLTH